MLKWNFSLIIFVVIVWQVACHAHAQMQHIAFYYGLNPPLSELSAFDVIVVDKDAIDPKSFKTKHGGTAYAYLSIGEMSENDYLQSGKKSWILKENKNWLSFVVDQKNLEWRNYILKTAEQLQQLGFDGLFLDTVDSYNHFINNQLLYQEQIKATAELILAIKKNNPTLKLISNRGFEIIDSIGDKLDAIAVESLFQTWNTHTQQYEAIPKTEHNRLLEKLKLIQTKFNLPIIAIDYIEPSHRDEARKIATQIKNYGFIPWVSDKELQTLGVSSIEVIPRKIAIISDNLPYINSVLLPPNRLIAMPIEQLGYKHEIIFHKNLSMTELLDPGQYAGIILWLETDHTNTQLFDWILAHRKQHIPILFINNLGFDETENIFKELGFELSSSTFTPSKLEFDHSMVGYEFDPILAKQPNLAIVNKQGKPIILAKNTQGNEAHFASITSWGGYSLYPNTIIELPNGKHKWIINPFQMLKKALRLQPIPVPDITTENGTRLLTIHIDGDGFGDESETEATVLAGEIIYKEIIDKYKLPTSISVIINDIETAPLEKKHKLIQLAKNMFSNEYIEAASHTYTHPFTWQSYDQNNITLVNYEQEVLSSIKYINQFLLPSNKRTNLLFWSGNCDPSAKVLRLCKEHNILTINGGDTYIREQDLSITNISSAIVNKSGFIQILAPIQNDNIYTNLWSGPYYGYQNVIKTFELTNEPIRTKPYSIYYHFYSGTKHASLLALHRIYEYITKKLFNPIFISNYIQKAHDLHETTFYLDQNKDWHVKTQGFIKELKIPAELGFPDIDKSKNVIGYKNIGPALYVHLGPEKSSSIHFVKTQATKPYLMDCNCIVNYLSFKPNFHFQIKSYIPPIVTLANVNNCRVWVNNQETSWANTNASIKVLHIKEAGTHDVQIHC